MPLPIQMAHQLAHKLAEVRKKKTKGIDWLRPDGKTQVSVRYEDGEVTGIEAIVVSTQHDEKVKQKTIEEAIREHVIKPIVPAKLITNKTKIHVNPTGRFVIGGPQGDAGLTGRKIIVDTYGGYARHGGGAFSGKDPSKVDRSAAYYARYIAKHVVAAGLAQPLRGPVRVRDRRRRAGLDARRHVRHRHRLRREAHEGRARDVRRAPRHADPGARPAPPDLQARRPRTATSAARSPSSRGRRRRSSTSSRSTRSRGNGHAVSNGKSNGKHARGKPAAKKAGKSPSRATSARSRVAVTAVAPRRTSGAAAALAAVAMVGGCGSRRCALVVLLAGFVPDGRACGLGVARGTAVCDSARAIEPMRAARTCPGWRALRGIATPASPLAVGRQHRRAGRGRGSGDRRARRARVPRRAPRAARARRVAGRLRRSPATCGPARCAPSAFTQTRERAAVVGAQIGFGVRRRPAVADRSHRRAAARRRRGASRALDGEPRAVTRREARRRERRRRARRAARRSRPRDPAARRSGHGDVAYQVARRPTSPRRVAPPAGTSTSRPTAQPIAREARIAYATGTLQFDVAAFATRAARARRHARAARSTITVNGSAATTDARRRRSRGPALSPRPSCTIADRHATSTIIERRRARATARRSTVPSGGAATWSLASDEFGDAQLSTYVYGEHREGARAPHQSRARALARPAARRSRQRRRARATRTRPATSVHFFQRDRDVREHRAPRRHRVPRVRPLGALPLDPARRGRVRRAAVARASPTSTPRTSPSDPGIGRGFYFDDDAAARHRSRRRASAWPRRRRRSIRTSAGLIIGGALWDLRKALVAQLGHRRRRHDAREQIFTGVMQRSPRHPDELHGRADRR